MGARMSEIKIKTIYPKQSDVTSEYNNQQQTISELQKQLKEAREALEFYSKTENYRDDSAAWVEVWDKNGFSIEFEAEKALKKINNVNYKKGRVCNE